jgi:hypothetical protein
VIDGNLLEVAAIAVQAAECPGCIEMSSPGMMSGMMIGLVLMMAAPFLVIVGIGGGLLRAHRRAVSAEVEQHDH